MEAMSELQSRRDAQTRAELSAVAIGLFVEHGFAETTMDDVAEASGVSRRTIYRHYANKEDLVFEQTRLWMEVLNETVATRRPEESTRDVCCRGILAVTDYIKAHRDEVLPGYGVVAQTPALQSRYARTNREWLERYTELLRPDAGPDPAHAEIQAAVIAGALVGGTDGAVRAWFAHPSLDLTDLIESMLEQVKPLWPKASLKAP